MIEQRLLFQRFKEIKDYGVSYALKDLQGNVESIISHCPDEFSLLRTKILTEEEKEAFKTILDKTISGVMHSIMVTFDGGDQLSFPIDITNMETGESLKNYIALHEEFFGYLLEVED